MEMIATLDVAVEDGVAFWIWWRKRRLFRLWWWVGRRFRLLPGQGREVASRLASAGDFHPSEHSSLYIYLFLKLLSFLIL
jgi:hypothetical protein